MVRFRVHFKVCEDWECVVCCFYDYDLKPREIFTIPTKR